MEEENQHRCEKLLKGDCAAHFGDEFVDDIATTRIVPECTATHPICCEADAHVNSTKSYSATQGR